MDSPFWLSLADAVEKWTTSAGILLGGGWAFYRFALKRESDTALALDLKCASLPYDKAAQPSHLVTFEVTLKNTGPVRLRAKRKRLVAYHDSVEDLKYSGDLLLRRVPSGMLPGTKVGWFSESNEHSPFVTDIECDILFDYELDGGTDFWMEPGETYPVGVSVVLEEGTYLAMVTFVGDADDNEFWRRVYVVNVPALAS